jgi:hypothetical protein
MLLGPRLAVIANTYLTKEQINRSTWSLRITAFGGKQTISHRFQSLSALKAIRLGSIRDNGREEIAFA